MKPVSRWISPEDLRVDGDVPRNPFSFYGVELLDLCEGIAHGNPHLPHQENGRFCLGQGGLIDDLLVTIVVTERPVPVVTGSAKGFWLSNNPQSIIPIGMVV